MLLELFYLRKIEVILLVGYKIKWMYVMFYDKKFFVRGLECEILGVVIIVMLFDEYWLVDNLDI